MKKTNAQFNPDKDGLKIIHFVGNAFAHIKSMETREGIPLKLKGQTVEGVEQSVFNFTFKIHESTKDLVFKKIADGEETEVSGQEVLDNTEKNWKDSGTFFCSMPPENARWINKKYTEVVEKLGIEFPVGEDNTIELLEIEEEDVIGLPVIISLGIETAKDGKKYNKVINLLPWDKGTRLTPEQLFPEGWDDEEKTEPQF